MAGSGRLVDTPLADVEVDELLTRVRAGNMDAYGELYTRYSGFADKVARRVSRRNADDLVSESFRRILVTMQNGGGPTNGFGPYLATVIRSVGAGQALPFEETPLAAAPESPVETPDVDPRVSTAYLSLPQQWQDAIWYTDVEGLKPRHAAPLMGLASANAFSALRKRARAGLRSAYLTQVVDEACNEEVRQALWMMAEGVLDAEVVDEVVDRHLDECDRCAAVAWRVAAVPGGGLAVALGLAPAILAFHGIVPGATVLPAASAGVGVSSALWAAPRRLWRVFVGNSTAVAGGAATAVVAAGAVAASVMAMGGTDDAAAPPTSTMATVTSAVELDDAVDAGSPDSDRASEDAPVPTPGSTPVTETAPAPTIPAAADPPALAMEGREPFAEIAPFSAAPDLAPTTLDPAGVTPTTAPPAAPIAPSPPAPVADVAVPATPAAPTVPTTVAPSPPPPAPVAEPIPTSSVPATTVPATTPPPTTVPATTVPATAPPATTVPATVPATTAPPATVPPTTTAPVPATTVPPAPPQNCFSIAGGRIVICLPPGVPWPPPWWPAGS